MSVAVSRAGSNKTFGRESIDVSPILKNLSPPFTYCLPAHHAVWPGTAHPPARWEGLALARPDETLRYQ